MRMMRLLRTLSRHARPARRASSRRGRILAIKWGMNPNSSSLGVDVTFLLAGAAALSMITPFVAALMRWRKPAADPHLQAENQPPMPQNPHDPS